MNELLYAFYVLSGNLDAILAANHVHFIDTGLLMSIILLLIILVNLFFYPKIKFPVNYLNELALLVGVLLLAVVSLVYTPSQHYSIYKTLYFTKEIIISFSFPFLVKYFNIKRFIKWYIIILFTISIIYFYYMQTLPYQNNEIYKGFVGRYLNVGISNGIAFLIILLSKEKIFRKDFAQFLVGFVALSFLVLSSARGPLFFLFLILIVILFIKGFSMKVNKVWLNYLFFVVFVSLPLLVYLFTDPKFIQLFNHLMSRSIDRFSKFIAFLTGNTNEDMSSMDRVYMWKFTIEKIFSKLSSVLFGYGIGSFGIMYKGIDGRAYPHNTFLESWFELGFFAMIFFVLFFAIPLIQKRKNPFIPDAVIYYLLLNIMKSYTFADMRQTYVFMALFIYPYIKDAVKPRLRISIEPKALDSP